ncbi:MAG: hypothetical protein MPJ50_03340 [Pirellulales bacterium]|nr:hypothetical protein [Pirellulales bacterium]
MLRHRFQFYLALAALTCALISGCSQKTAEDFSTKEGFSQYLRANCVRSESHFNPRPMRLKTLRTMTGEPVAVADVDKATQMWQFDFKDGTMDLYVVLEPGASWRDKSPKVFIDMHRTGLLP